jgi:hypothetical protein
MNTHRCRTITLLLATLLTIGLGGTGTAAAQPPGTLPATTRCQWTVAELPRSPDAVEGWYHGCPPSTLPHSPTGVDGWTH